MRHAAPLVVLATLLLAAPVSATTRTVDIEEFDFGPGSLSAVMGDMVRWTNKDGFTHTSTRSGFPGWTLTVPSDASKTRAFKQAGTFSYICTIHDGMSGSVKVPVKVTPVFGGPSTTFTVKVATIDAPAGSTYVIQRRAPGGSFRAWRTTTAKQVTFKSSVKGTWQFRSLVKKTSNGLSSGFSPTDSVTID